MRKIKFVIPILISVFIFTFCDSADDTGTAPPTAAQGNIYVESTPTGAQIWLDGVNTNQTTPDTLENLDVGSYNITLKLTDFFDTTFTVVVVENQTHSSTITLTSNLFITSFGPVRIYETLGTTVTQPSGIDLSTGVAYGVSGVNKDDVDIYYSTSGTGGQGFLVQSAHLNSVNGLTRVTDFQAGSASDLNDEIDSPLRSSGTWTDQMSDRETNYVFLYDNDSYYSKIKIVNWGGGTPGDPAWVEVQWWYNETVGDNRF